MKRLLISWLAVDNDFTDNGKQININGPTVNMHGFHFQYDEHIILYTPNFETKALQLCNYLKSTFSGRRVTIKPIHLDKVHQNLNIIKNKVETILLENSNKQIDILLSTGSGTMKIAWYICHTTLNLNTKLLQILKLEDSETPHEPDLIELNIEKSTIPVSAIIREQNINKTTKLKDTFIVNSTKEQYNKGLQIAQTDKVSILITGNTGTGKEILARYIHKNSPRRNKEFIAVNCAALNDQLLESRLFGHKKGIFTGAYADYKGVFEQANHGTIFLDEIGDISPYMQQALLRFLQEKEIQPIGGKTKKVDVRIIAATNKNIQKLISSNKFRADLFYRLGISLKLPDFKDYSVADKLEWIDFLIEKKQKQLKRKNKIKITEKLKNFLIGYDFTGNIRELINIIEYFYVFQEKKASLNDLPEYINEEKLETPLNLETVKQLHAKKTYKLFNQNKTKTAEALGISLNTLKRLISNL